MARSTMRRARKPRRMRRRTTRTSTRPKRPRYRTRKYRTSRRGLRRGRSSRYLRKTGLAKKSITISLPVYGYCTSEETGGTGNFYFGDAGLIMSKTLTLKESASSAADWIPEGPAFLFTNSSVPFSTDPKLSKSTLSRVRDDFMSLAADYHWFRSAGIKFTWKPNQGAKGMIFARNCNDYAWTETANTVLKDIGMSLIPTDPLISDCYQMTIGEHLTTCKKFKANRGFSVYHKHRVPRRCVLRNGGWLPGPNGLGIIDGSNQNQSAVAPVWQAGASAFYFKNEDSDYHALPLAQRQLVAKAKSNDPIGVMTVRYYFHFKKKDRQFSTAEVVIPTPYGIVKTELSKDQAKIKTEPVYSPPA